MKFFKKIMILLFSVIAIISLAVFLFIQQNSFGKKPYGKRLERIIKSPNYREGNFQNLSETKMMTKEASYFKLIKSYIWKEVSTEPDFILPSVKRNLKELPSEKPTITWFGHSTILIQIKGKNILIDPIFSERASPVQYSGSKSYSGTRIYTLADFPSIDYVLLTHDHYDHLDYETMQQLKSHDVKFYAPLGLGAHLESWGIEANKITELDWWETEKINPEIHLIATPARHFSGRSLFDRNKTLWASYVLKTNDHSIFIGGDSGYDKHFKEIGDRYGPFDLVLLESGQYHPYWAYIHMMPEETVQASMDLKGKVLLPIHWGKFTLALHPWDEPINRVIKKADELNIKVTTPMIGELVIIDSLYPTKKWWQEISPPDI